MANASTVKLVGGAAAVVFVLYLLVNSSSNEVKPTREEIPPVIIPQVQEVAKVLSLEEVAAQAAQQKLLEWRLGVFRAGLQRNARENAFIAGQPGPAPVKKDVYLTTVPYMACPGEMKLLGGPGDGSKWVCALEKITAPCAVVSLGSGTDTTFERDVLRQTGCIVHTFDCTVNGHSVHERHFFHKLCLGSSDQARASDQFITFDDAMRTLIKVPVVDILKMDIEGWEFDVLAMWGVDAGSQIMPRQLLLEVHSDDLYLNTPFYHNAQADVDKVFMFPANKVTTVVIGQLMAHLNSLGFGIVFRELNAIDNQACEFTLYNFLPPAGIKHL